MTETEKKHQIKIVYNTPDGRQFESKEDAQTHCKLLNSHYQLSTFEHSGFSVNGTCHCKPDLDWIANNATLLSYIIEKLGGKGEQQRRYAQGESK